MPEWYRALDPYERQATIEFCIQYELNYTLDRHGILGQLTREEKNRIMIGREHYFKHLDPHRLSGAEDTQDPDGPGRKKQPGRMTEADRRAADEWIEQKKAG
jgi:hypothetical protein